MIGRIQFIFFAIFVFAVTVSNAQQMQISPSSHDDFSFGYSKIIGQDEGGYYVLTSNLSLNIASDRIGFRSRKYKLAYLSLSLNRKWEMNVNAHGDDASLDAITFFNDKVMVVSSTFDKSINKINYYLSFIDSTSKIERTPSVIASFQPVTNDYEKCKVIISASKEKFVLITREFSSDKSQSLFAAIINDKLELITTKNGIIPFSEKTFDFSGYTLSNAGDLVLLGINSEKIRTLSSKRKTDYFVYSSPIDTLGFREFNISGEKNITGLGIEFDNVNHQAVIAGFYSDKESFVGAGIFYATLKIETNNDVIIKARPVDGQQNIRLKGERNMGSGMSLVSYPIERIVLRRDGGAVIVAESAYTTEYSYYDSFSQSFARRLEYNFDNVIIISINNEGVADWSSIVDKRQVSMDDGGVFSSFCSLLNSEQLVILYNDNIGRRNKVVSVSVDNLGSSNRLKPAKQIEGMQLLPRGGKQVSENELIVPALVKRKLHFVKFTF